VRRVLKPKGTFLLYDFVRTPMEEFLSRPLVSDQVDPDTLRRRWLKLFAAQCKYTIDDWTWVLGEGGFEVASITAPHQNGFRVFVAVPKGSA
jgi:hypothetical protein